MSGKRRPPQARDRAIGAQLRAIREQQTTLSLEAAAALLQWSPATMSRTETGKRHVSAEDVATILATYRVPVAQRDTLVARAKAIDEPGWYSRPMPGVPHIAGELASYENEAVAVTDWSINLIPGLLQTHEYAMAYMLDAGVTAEDAQSRWMFRLRRQQRLPLLDYTAYIGEVALRTPFGRAFGTQLRKLVDAPDRGLGVRMVPGHVAHSALLGSWMLLEFPHSPPIVHVELRRSAVYLHDDEVTPYLDQRRRLAELALSTAATRTRLMAMIEQMEDAR